MFSAHCIFKGTSIHATFGKRGWGCKFGGDVLVSPHLHDSPDSQGIAWVCAKWRVSILVCAFLCVLSVFCVF